MPAEYETEGQVVHIISTPRSGSTLMMRVMAQALGGKTAIYSEPGVATFAYAHDPNWVPHLREVEEDLKTFSGVDRRVIEDARRNHVVVKDMIHTIHEHITSGESILPENPNVKYIFLVRNPHSALISLQKFVGALPTSPKGLISYEMLYGLYDYLKDKAANKPLVVNADVFFREFPSDLSLLLNSMRIALINDSKEQANLEPLDMQQAIKKWHDPSKVETFTDWHERAAISSEVQLLPQYEVADGKPTFNEIPSEHREAYKQAYQDNFIFYQLFLELANSWK